MLPSFKMYIRYINVWIDFWSSYIYIYHIWCDFLNLLFWNDISKLIKIFYALQNIEFVQWCSFHWLCRNIYKLPCHDFIIFTVYYCADIHPEIVNIHNNSEWYLFFFAIYVIYHFYIHHSFVENMQYLFIPSDYWLKRWFMFLFVSINQLYHVIWHFLEFLSDERQHENMIDHLK